MAEELTLAYQEELLANQEHPDMEFEDEEE